MRAKLFGLLAVGLLAGPTAANAAYLYEFNYSDSGSYVGFTLPEIVTTTTDLGLAPFLLDGYTITQSRVYLLGANLCFYFASAGVTGDCQSGSIPSGGALTFNTFLTPFAVGTYDTNSRLNLNVNLAELLTLRISSVSEPSTLALLVLGLAGLGLSRRRKAN